MHGGRTFRLVLALAAAVVVPTPVGGSTYAPVIDGHADFAIHYLRRDWRIDAFDIEDRLPGQSDITRWRAGGVNGALATVGSDLAPGSKHHFPRVLASLDWFDRLIAKHGGSLAAARSADDFDKAAAAGKIALMPALEGGEQIDASFANLHEAYRRGVRSIGIVYDHHNAIGEGAMAFPHSAAVAGPAHDGLSDFGRLLIAEMNLLGMMVDLSHASEATALHAIAESRAPVIFSHSGARALADSPRNLSDAVLRLAAARGGIVMVPLVPYLTTTEHWRWWTAGEAEYGALAIRHGEDKEAISRAMAQWDSANPQPTVTVADVANQIDYVARIAGKDHVGIGTDFDGMGDFTIPALKDAAMVPALFDELAARGWSRVELEKLARLNFLRVLRKVEAIAGELRSSASD